MPWAFERLGNGTQRRRTARLYLLKDKEHIGGEAICIRSDLHSLYGSDAATLRLLKASDPSFGDDDRHLGAFLHPKMLG
jgi:hypothetical protein